MLPSIDLRIANMIKALEQVILPALPRRERLARDQANLVLGHLRLMSPQWKTAVRFEEVTLDLIVGLAERFGEIFTGDQRALLEAAIASARAADRRDIKALEDAYTLVGNAIDAIIRGDADHAPLPQAAVDALLDYGAVQALRERAWFKGNGLDPHAAELPEISAVL